MSKKLPSTRNLRAAFVALAVGLVGCNSVANVAKTSYTTTSSNGANNNLPRVVATTGVLCDLTKQVAQETINLICLTSPDTSPHFYQPKPEDRKAVEQAKLIFFNGYNLEQSTLKLIKVNKKPVPKIAVAYRAVPQPLQSRKDGKTTPDPYVWHNARYGMKMVDVISTYLSKTFPKNAPLYTKNAAKIKNELSQLDTWIKSRIGSIPKNQRKLVTSDNAMSYYSQAYGLSYIAATEGIGSQEKPSDPSGKKVIKSITQAKVSVIFPAATINPNLTNTVAKEAKVKVSKRELFAEDLGEPGSEGDTYQNMMVANTRTIVEGLGGTYLIFEPKTK
jgi:manganese/iron transport system substrate-binding protein